MGRFRANVPRRLGKTAKDRGEIAMNMIRSAKNQIAELTAAAYRAAVQEGLLPEGVQTIPRRGDPQGYRQRRLYDHVLPGRIQGHAQESPRGRENSDRAHGPERHVLYER